MKSPLLHSLIGLMLATSIAMSAQTLTFNLDTVTEPGITPPTLLPSLVYTPWAYTTFSEVVVNQVQMTIGSHLVNDEFISSVGINVDPTLNLSAFTFSNEEKSGEFTSTKISKSVNGINEGGGTRFDIGFGFDTSNGTKRFDGQDWVSYVITYTGQGSFTPNSFNFLDKSNQLNVIAHVQSIGDNNTSAWITNGSNPASIPEPSTAILGVFGTLALLRRRK